MSIPVHKFCLPFKQYLHLWQQFLLTPKPTISPTLKSLTSLPISETCAIISCPKHIGYVGGSHSFLPTAESEWDKPVYNTFALISFGFNCSNLKGTLVNLLL